MLDICMVWAACAMPQCVHACCQLLSCFLTFVFFSTLQHFFSKPTLESVLPTCKKPSHWSSQAKPSNNQLKSLKPASIYFIFLKLHNNAINYYNMNHNNTNSNSNKYNAKEKKKLVLHVVVAFVVACSNAG